MPIKTLFSVDDPQSPDPARIEPVLWLKRLVILRDLNARPPIRDIPFRRGLNIVQTRKREVGEKNVVGHSVGKTLLVRLIRYTLGEHQFARKEDQARIARHFPTAHVIAHWRVNQADWIVIRPLSDSRNSKTIAVLSDDWQSAINGQPHQPFEEFLSAVNEAAFAGLGEFTLPRAGRSPKWMDALGWLARDYECGYRAANDWRHKAAESGPGLDLDDNSLVLQWMAGLMGAEEIVLKRHHQELLGERQKVKTNRDAAQKTVDVSGPSLFTKLELQTTEGEDADPNNDPESLFAARVNKKAEDTIGSLKRLVTDRNEQSNVALLDLAEEAAQEDLTNADAEVRAVNQNIERVGKLIKHVQLAGSSTIYSRESPYQDCPYDKCPMRLDNRPTPTPDPAKDDRLEWLNEELENHNQSLPEKIRLRDKLRSTHKSAKEQVRRERERLSEEISGIDRQIGEWQTYSKDATAYCQAMKTLGDTTSRMKSLDSTIEESYKSQEVVRKDLTELRKRHSRCYQKILQEIFGGHARGEITVDGNGLRPTPDSGLSPNGAALTVMTSVLAFDISSVAASILGIGHHPRFLIHDSPREGDMEEPLFNRLFEVARGLESQFGDNGPSFQYIVTTTTSPPVELSDENGPFVRVTLDARMDADRLLREPF